MGFTSHRGFESRPLRSLPSATRRRADGRYARSRLAPVAQLDRASVYGTEGHRFESCRGRFGKACSRGAFLYFDCWHSHPGAVGGNTGGNRTASFPSYAVGPAFPPPIMASSLTESRVADRGEPLPDGVYALVEHHGEVVSYKARWRERDPNGVQRQRSKSFSRRAAGSRARANAAAVAHRDGVREIVRAGDTVLRADRAAGILLGDLFKEWITHHAAPNTGERYARDAVRTWDKHIEARLGRVKLGALADDPGIIVRFHEDLQEARLAISARRASLALLRAVLRWGRRRSPRALSVAASGLSRAPGAKRRRLIRATDPVAAERTSESGLTRSH